MAKNSPTFDSPPVVEVVLGLQFEPIAGFTNSHLGAFWSFVGGTWESPSDEPVLPQEFERFGEDRQWALTNTLRLNLTPKPAARAQFRSPDKTRLMQLQNGRLLYNWVSQDGAQYPRYDQIETEFKAVLARFEEFLPRYGLPSLVPNQWEVTYVNHLPRGKAWKDSSDWGKIFATNAMLPATIRDSRLEGVGAQWTYEIGSAVGRLHVRVQDGRLGDDKTEVLTLTLTARGPIPPGDNAMLAFLRGIEIGHGEVVNSFRDLASADSRKHWKEIS